MKKLLSFNLQLFADPNPNTNVTTSEGLTAEMKEAAKKLEFERAAMLRDKIEELKGNKQ